MRPSEASVEALRRLERDESENEKGKQSVRALVGRLREFDARVQAVTIEAEIARRRHDAKHGTDGR